MLVRQRYSTRALTVSETYKVLTKCCTQFHLKANNADMKQRQLEVDSYLDIYGLSSKHLIFCLKPQKDGLCAES